MSTLLVVDDNQQNLYMLQVLLSANGFQVELASNGAEALEKARRAPPDMIISDILMPVMDGFSLCRACKEDERLKNIPFVFYTATYTDPKDEEFALSLGADRFIIKPVEPDRFLALLSETWKHCEVGKPVVEPQPIEEAEHYKEYNTVLIRKLEDKMLQLEEANRTLERAITERKRVEEALRESEEKYRGIIEDMPAMICRFLPDGTLSFVNREYSRYFAREDHELIGKNFLQFVPRNEHEQVRNHFKSLSAATPVVTYEHKVQAPDGTIRWQRWTDRALLDQQGRVVEYQSIGNDITETRLAQTEKAELERQLQHVHKMEAIGTLAGGIAHDFNNLLQAILGYAQVLLGSKSDDHPDRSKLRNIVSAAERGARLVRALLTFSRSMESARRPLNLNQEVLTLSKLIADTFPEMIKVELDLGEDLGTINADPAQIEQVIMNLAVNARDAMREGGKLIIRTENVTPDEEFSRLHPEVVPCDYVSLTVTDTGQGMDEGTLARIFEPFFTTKEFGKGAGLGLAIVYGIVKSNKGLITCSSEPGKGTAFKVCFPQAEGQTQQETPATIDAPPERGTETILIVDDEEMIRDLWLEIGGNAGYRVITAADGESALELYRKEKDRVGLIMLDVIMPGMGGIRCLEELRRINPEARILLASGHMDGEFVKQGMSLGAKGHISKPFDWSRALKAVRDALDEA